MGCLIHSQVCLQTGVSKYLYQNRAVVSLFAPIVVHYFLCTASVYIHMYICSPPPSTFPNSLSLYLSLSLSHLSLCTGAGSDTHSHSGSTASPPPTPCPPHYHTLSTLTGSDSQCSSTESAILSTGEKRTHGGAELKPVSERRYKMVILLLLTCNAKVLDDMLF